jgi:glutamine amidotransferase
MIAIIDCEIGNLRSVQKAFEFIGAEASITADKARIAEASAIVLPGVGAFGDAAEFLIEHGLDETVKTAIAAGKPLLGICVGLQLFAGRSEEYGTKEAGLGLIKGDVIKLPDTVKIPEMGWNTIDIKRPECPIFKGIPSGSRFYLAHSFCLDPASMDEGDIAATTSYGVDYCSAVWHGNIFGVQFHPEKSGATGLMILRNFAELAASK